MQVIYGIHPVLESLKLGGKGIEKIVLARGRTGVNVEEILNLAELQGIPLQYVDRISIDKLADRRHHQGVVCICTDYAYASLNKMLSRCLESSEGSLILILDSIEDPQNLGSLIRSGHCFGFNGIIIPDKRAASVTPTVIKVSAGSAHHIPITSVSNIAKTIDCLKQEGFWIYGADTSLGKNLQGYDYKGHVGLVLGSEGKGLRPLVRKKCDFLITMPMAGKIDSLNVSVAGGIIMYEMMMSRGVPGRIPV